jgi:hypothetical protein
MTRSNGLVVIAAMVAALIVWAAPSVFPTGTTIYDPAKAWNGYTVLSPLGGTAAIVIDMNGNVVKRWEGYNSSAGGPVRVLPGGVVIAATGGNAGKQESLALVARDFDDKELWRFDHNEQITGPDGGMTWALRQHHDWQREDFPSGYYSPNAAPSVPPNGTAKTMVLTHTTHAQAAVAGEAMLEDDRLIELDANGKVTWEWVASDHIEEFHFDSNAREAIRGNAGRGAFDWFHMNSATYLGPNHWNDEGDKRFAPENVIISSRQTSLLAIVGRDGKIVWQIGPDYSATPELRAIGQVIGQHHAHLIPKGLPGAGNLLVFDNGGASGYGRPIATAPKGQNIYARPTSRVLEIDPVVLKLVWSYTAPAFFGTNISGAQRLANGNTLITEGPDGRVFEVTKDSAIVWEYVYPVFGGGKGKGTNSVYRAYRVPYAWIPQITRPAEQAVTPPKAEEFRVK